MLEDQLDVKHVVRESTARSNGPHMNNLSSTDRDTACARSGGEQAASPKLATQDAPCEDDALRNDELESDEGRVGVSAGVDGEGSQGTCTARSTREDIPRGLGSEEESGEARGRGGILAETMRTNATVADDGKISAQLIEYSLELVGGSAEC